MAIWQFDLYLVPRAIAPLGEVSGSTPFVSFESDGFDLPPLSLQGIEHKAVADQLSSEFGASRVLYGSHLYWGEEAGSRIDLSMDEGQRLAEVFVRIDARSDPRTFIESVCRLANMFDCHLFICEQPQVIFADPAVLFTAFLGSRALRFMKDPLGFLQDLPRS